MAAATTSAAGAPAPWSATTGNAVLPAPVRQASAARRKVMAAEIQSIAPATAARDRFVTAAPAALPRLARPRGGHAAAVPTTAVGLSPAPSAPTATATAATSASALPRTAALPRPAQINGRAAAATTVAGQPLAAELAQQEPAPSINARALPRTAALGGGAQVHGHAAQVTTAAAPRSTVEGATCQRPAATMCVVEAAELSLANFSCRRSPRDHRLQQGRPVLGDRI